eukprot:403346458
MGNQCGCGKEEDPAVAAQRLKCLIRIQARMRTYLARKKRNEIRAALFAQIFTGDRVNHQNAETWMLTQRIGVFDHTKYLVNDGQARIFFPAFVSLEDGRNYKGQWLKRKELKDGLGIMFWPDGTKYEGQFQNDYQTGYGRKLFSNGEFYIGNFQNDKANGFGVFQDLNGGKYEGNWKEDKQNGFGKEIWNNGAETYEGEFVDGKKNGKGKFSWSDGSYYEGDFVDGLFEGFGTYYFKESDKTFVGQFKDGKIDGEGEMKWANGSEYWGQFKDGKEDGEGTYRYPNGNLYIGKFKDGKQCGYAIYIDIEAQTKRHGEWRDGKRTQWLSSPEAINTDQSPIKRLSHVTQLHTTQ